jgi:glycosyltransferase involved in cell wall biosynthesis
MTPFSPWLGRELRGADVVHCHQYFTLSTFLAAWIGRLQGSRVFVTDLGGGGWTPGYQIDVSRWIDAHLPISRYAARKLPGANQAFRVIHGGVDLATFAMRPRPEHDGSVVFIGRLLPHKGIHHLLAAVDADTPVQLIGPAPDADYASRLATLARGKRVRFAGLVSDAEIVETLQRAMVLVHPTPADAAGDAGVNELFGLVLVEAMACGCPVVASRVASLPEIVEDDVSGILVPPNQPQAIARAIAHVAEPDRWLRMSAGARARAETFSWSRAADATLAAYRERRG